MTHDELIAAEPNTKQMPDGEQTLECKHVDWRQLGQSATYEVALERVQVFLAQRIIRAGKCPECGQVYWAFAKNDQGGMHGGPRQADLMEMMRLTG